MVEISQNFVAFSEYMNFKVLRWALFMNKSLYFGLVKQFRVYEFIFE